MIFKREKEVARRLEFDGLYVTEQPPEEDIKGQWDRLVINAPYVHCHMINWADVILTCLHLFIVMLQVVQYRNVKLTVVFQLSIHF